MTSNLDNINYDEFDFIDMGCGTADRGYFLAKRVFGAGRCLGVDIDDDKVQIALREIENNPELCENYTVICEDMTNFGGENVKDKFRFATANHFLEHVPGFSVAKDILDAAINASREFVFVRQPWFDNDAELFKMGLKTYYSDWNGHLNPLTSYNFYRMGRDFKLKGSIKDFVILGLTKIQNSSNPIIHPLASPFNEHDYDPIRHPSKDVNIEFEGLYKDICVFFIIDENSPIEDYIERLDVDYEVIYDSRMNSNDDDGEYVIDIDKLDFVDVGSGRNGASLIYGVAKFNGRNGLGIEYNPKFVENIINLSKIDGSRLQGHKVLCEDFFNVDTKSSEYYKKFRFTTAINFVQNLDNIDEVEDFISRCVDLSYDFVFLNQPSNEYHNYLENLGFKRPVHQKSRFMNDEFITILKRMKNEGKIVDFALYETGLIEDSTNSAVKPLDDNNSDVIKFNNVYKDTIVFVQTADVLDIQSLADRLLGRKNLIYSSKN
ncbi:methyltransferase domain-containing protein [Methanosphaera cuniculi]|uniref:methyltransferase domain-containing protein n=1 Tax=Methanosphaera cuniculi TaxID=1077256 RepID=UPI0026EAA0D6|nr:class I SAM-dependent methyltransferase [Methanosphaera cuniculi]